jgi:hypothetical protein
MTKFLAVFLIKMNKKLFAISIVILLLLSWFSISTAKSTLPPQKQTVLGLYVTAKEAYERQAI